MLSGDEIQSSVRRHILTLGDDTDVQNAPVAKSTAPAIAAVADGYTRSDGGSFLTDGFARGLELTSAGFSANPKRQIVNVSAGKITVSTVVPVQASAGGRALTVSLPASRSWENVSFDPVTGIPFIEEQFIEGPRTQVGIGPGTDIDIFSTVIFLIHVGLNTGQAARRYADAIIRLFAPGTNVPLILPTTPADRLDVREMVAPTGSQGYRDEDGGKFTIPVTIPLIGRTLNAI